MSNDASPAALKSTNTTGRSSSYAYLFLNLAPLNTEVKIIYATQERTFHSVHPIMADDGALATGA